MKIDLKQKFYSHKGEVMQDNGKDVLLSDVITNALLTPLKDDEKLSGSDKSELFKIWFDEIKDKDTANLKAEQISTIKERLGKLYGQLIVGQSYNYLDQ